MNNTFCSVRGCNKFAVYCHIYETVDGLRIYSNSCDDHYDDVANELDSKLIKRKEGGEKIK